MKPMTFENRFNHERVICDDPRKVQTIEGVDYLQVRKENSAARGFLMRKDSLVRVADKAKT